MSLLTPNESHAFQSFLSQVDYAESDQVAPEWSMYSSPDMMQEDLDPAQVQKREALAKATKDLMALDGGRWQQQNGAGNPYGMQQHQHQQAGYDAYQQSPLEQHHTPNMDYEYGHYQQQHQQQHHQQQMHQSPYTHSRHEMFPFLNKQQQAHYPHHDQVLPPISVNVNGNYASSPSRASATPPISASSTHSFSIATPTLPSPNNTPFLPMNVSNGSLQIPQPHRGIPSPAGSHPSSSRGSPALPPSLSNMSKRSTYDDLPLHPTKRQRMSPVSAAAHPYPMQRSRSHPIPGAGQYPNHYLPNGQLDGGVHMHQPRISSSRLAPPSRAASVSSNCSSRPGSSHASMASLHPNPSHTASSKPALLSPSQKKANHIQSEQKRRANIRRGYEALCQTVPALREAIRDEEMGKGGKGSANGDADMDFEDDKSTRRSTRSKRTRGKTTKDEAANDKVDGRAGPRSENVVLSKTIDYITELLAEQSTLLDRMRTARSALPFGHPALTPLCQNLCVFKEKKSKNGDSTPNFANKGDENAAMISLNGLSGLDASKFKEGAIIKDGVVMVPLWDREWRGGDDDDDDKDEDGDGDDDEESA
ncbi:hypothetical protein CCMSSC00406_0002303 [Pleurotus cornucopiae]|uniref:Uncharacterized protein n=1 Tax=Pleurotus cornucopiae TaxID=5321 RepID=A0ACB7J367_PLECO|nr:hypothetical protein CCMSSC00406_0002303 [Pleurotus cornucopiae]